VYSNKFCVKSDLEAANQEESNLENNNFEVHNSKTNTQDELSTIKERHDFELMY
jgi:hypothetical protein